MVGITANKNQDGLLERIKIKTIANRERESLDLMLKVDNVKLIESNQFKDSEAEFIMAKSGDFKHESSTN